MANEITGKIIKLLPEQKGQGKNGTWRKQDVILETPGQYPRKVCVAIWGDKIDEFALHEGDQVKIEVDIDSREFNNRWYTDVKAWKLVRYNTHQEQPTIQSPVPSKEISGETAAQVPDENDDLPF